MASTLCKFCEELSIERLLKIVGDDSEKRRNWKKIHPYDDDPLPRIPFYPHQPSLVALEQSAKDGCSFCQFMTDCFHSSRGSWCMGDASIRVELDQDSASENIDGISIIRGLHLRFSTLGISYLELFAPSGQIMTIDDTFRVGRQKLNPNIASAATFTIARGWLNECRENHSGCRRESLPALPTRVIDVGASESHAAPRVIITNELQDDYVALSHCWGGDIATKLKTDTLVPFQESLPYAELPQNFRDAITITRELGIRYLWIDSLCILQDSEQDWAAESARMGLVYQDATLTLSAMIPPNSKSGILNPNESHWRPPTISHKMRVYDSKHLSNVEVVAELQHRTDPENELERMDKLWGSSPLTSRGWTLQEFILSHRNLFYGRDQIYWSCPKGFRQADGSKYDRLPIQFQTVSQAIHRNRLSSTIPSEMPTGSDQKRVLSDYYSIVQEYCMRALTKSSDKLPALAGIASSLQPVLPGQYLAGIWTCDVITGLLWRRSTFIRESYDPSSDRRDSSAPSWSWAAAVGQIYFQHVDKLPPTPWQARLVDYNIVPLNRANPFGQVESGQIVLEGLTIPILQTSSDVDPSSLVPAASVELNPYKDGLLPLYHSPPAAFRYNNESGEGPLDGQKVDNIIDSCWNSGKPLPPEIEDIFSGRWVVNSPDFKEDGLCVLLLHAEKQDHRWWAESDTVGLMLRPVPSKSGSLVHERVGYAQTARFCLKWLKTLETRVLTLV
ncbi:heterokaryon incompatibility protein-domain-containing protein [Chaetomium sp. MPI-CAGE-AT-0009]|nr:heterokaryon incompatibility protein-domain-containing protein [Chaetomium sp. MPI-CAGE-AT-0009]